MKNHILPFAATLLLAGGFVAAAQNNNGDDQSAAQRADTSAAAGTNTPALTDTTNEAMTDPEEIARQARIAAAAKQADAPANKLPASLETLQVIAHNNIFDPRRVPYTRPRDAVVAPTVVETFTLRGTDVKVGKGSQAMFVGDGVPTYRPTCCIGDKIGQFKIEDITWTNVTLVDTKSTNSAEIVLTLGKGLTRSDGGPWKPAYFTPSYEPLYAANRGASSSDMPSAGSPFPAIAAAGSDTFAPPDFSAPGDFTQNDFNAGGRQRGRGRNANNGGFVNNGGRAFGSGNPAFAPAQPAAPAGPVDPIVLARLQARRAAEQ